MAYRIIPLESFPRREQLEYFGGMADPYVGVTVETDVGELLSACRRGGVSFFLASLWSVCRAANSVAELRRRISGGQVVEYDRCDTSHTVLRPDGAYGYCRLSWHGDFFDYLPRAVSLHEAAKVSGSLDDGEDSDSLLFISTLPWLHYSSLRQPTPTPADSNPRITWGKFVQSGESASMPVTLLANHALVDGVHIARFYSALEESMGQLARQIDERMAP